MQKITIIGNICNIEMKNDVLKFSVAVNEKYKEQKTVEFFNCVAFSKPAETLEKYANKGDKIYIEGKFKTNEFEGKKYTSLIVNGFEFLGSKQSEKKADKSVDVEDIDDEIPF